MTLDAHPRRRIKVQTQTRVQTARGEQPVLMVALGAQTALLLAAGPLGKEGEIVEVHLPAVGGEVVVTSGVEKVDRVAEGYVITVQFIVAEQAVRRALDELLNLLLQGDGGGERRHPRIRHDIPIAYGEMGQLPAQLEEISVSGMSMRVSERMAEGSQLKVSIPDHYGGVRLSVRGRVINSRPSEDGKSCHIGVAFETLEPKTVNDLRELLAELVRG